LFLLIQLHLLPSSSLTPFSWIITVYSMFLAYSNNLKKKHRTTFGELQKNIFSKLRLDSFVSDEHRVDYPSFQPFSHLIFSLCSFHIAPFPFFFTFFLLRFPQVKIVRLLFSLLSGVHICVVSFHFSLSSLCCELVRHHCLEHSHVKFSC